MSRPTSLTLAYLSTLATEIRSGRVDVVAFAVETAENGDETLIVRTRELNPDAETPAFIPEAGACLACGQSNKLVDVGQNEVMCTACNASQPKDQGR